MSDFDAILNQRAADAEMPGNLFGRSTGEHESLQRFVRNQRRGAHGVGCFFVVVVIVASYDFLVRSLSLWERVRVRAPTRETGYSFPLALRPKASLPHPSPLPRGEGVGFPDDCQPVRFMTEKNMCDFFH
jgi:hypothetical protein